jgi:hypothetical protein
MERLRENWKLIIGLLLVLALRWLTQNDKRIDPDEYEDED